MQAELSFHNIPRPIIYCMALIPYCILWIEWRKIY
jgi:hypothetical protein